MAARQATVGGDASSPERGWATDPATLVRVRQALTRQLPAGMPAMDPCEGCDADGSSAAAQAPRPTYAETYVMAAGRRSPFAVDEDAALAEFERTWADGGYHAFSVDDGIWSAISSDGEVFTGDTPDALDWAIRAHWQAMQ